MYTHTYTVQCTYIVTTADFWDLKPKDMHYKTEKRPRKMFEDLILTYEHAWNPAEIGEIYRRRKKNKSDDQIPFHSFIKHYIFNKISD